MRLPLSGCFCLVVVLVLSGLPALAAGDYERLIAEKLRNGIVDGEIIELAASTGPFIGIYKQSTRDTRGAALILHSMAAHPDWPQVVAPLRSALPDTGWTTLSLQLPVLSPSKSFSTYGRTLDEGRVRIAAAVRMLLDRGYQNLVIIGYGFGAVTGANYLATTKNQPCKAFIAISPQAQPFLKPRIDLLQMLRKIEIPVLDIYGSRDFDAIMDAADDRRLAGKERGGRNYFQVRLEGADYYYSGMEPVLIKRIRGWLDRHAPGVHVDADTLLQDKTGEEQEQATSEAGYE